ncbi:AraC family transcriptional regulator [Marinomonas sp. THO17]|uniref:AraC family transcriptional regulator n=1 Tax=Marinomonas sp. THO17 TaxID=3149048 RepID=UPI00336BD9BC
MKPTTHPLFWRDEGLPFVELRQVLDGRLVSYAPHSHETWSIGAILNGQSEFVCADRLHAVEQGHLVVMNPQVVHACNPKQDSPWAYYMMHLDKDWLAAQLFAEGHIPSPEWHDSQADTLLAPEYFSSFVELCQQLMSNRLSVTEKVDLTRLTLLRIWSELQSTKMASCPTQLQANPLYDVADYLNLNCFDDTPIAQISAQFGYSTGYLMRAFRRHFNLTPHAYRLNRRIQLGQTALKQGRSIVDVAHEVGFNDQAHFQRTFKQRVAATPDQYRRAVLKPYSQTAGSQ